MCIFRTCLFEGSHGRYSESLKWKGLNLNVTQQLHLSVESQLRMHHSCGFKRSCVWFVHQYCCCCITRGLIGSHFVGAGLIYGGKRSSRGFYFQFLTAQIFWVVKSKKFDFTVQVWSVWVELEHTTALWKKAKPIYNKPLHQGVHGGISGGIVRL